MTTFHWIEGQGKRQENETANGKEELNPAISLHFNVYETH